MCVHAATVAAQSFSCCALLLAWNQSWKSGLSGFSQAYFQVFLIYQQSGLSFRSPLSLFGEFLLNELLFFTLSDLTLPHQVDMRNPLKQEITTYRSLSSPVGGSVPCVVAVWVCGSGEFHCWCWDSLVSPSQSQSATVSVWSLDLCAILLRELSVFVQLGVKSTV